MEPPPGADPGRSLYESEAAAVRGGAAGHPGLEPGVSGSRARRVYRIPLMAIEWCMERIAGIEPASSLWKSVALPLSYIRMVAPAGSEPASAAFQATANPSQLESHEVGKQGLEPCPPGPRPGALTLTLHPGELPLNTVETRG